MELLPRVIRLKDAPKYVGLERHAFNQYVRPYVTQIPLGKRGIGFDRLDLEAWFQDHKQRNGIPATKINDRRNSLWQKRERQDSINAKGSGTSTNNSSANDFATVLERLI